MCNRVRRGVRFLRKWRRPFFMWLVNLLELFTRSLRYRRQGLVLAHEKRRVLRKPMKSLRMPHFK